MSKYYKIKGLKVRVSDHEPNFSMNKFRGVSDIELYIKSADNRLLSVTSQLECVCDRRNLDINDFQEIVNDFQDGTYDINYFSRKVEEVEEESNFASLNSLRNLKEQALKSNAEKLQGYTLSRFAKHAEIKALSEKTGVSQSFIKRHFEIR